MPRTRASARDAGTRFETAVAEYLKEWVDDRIERRARNGANDRGDISGVTIGHHSYGRQRVVLECKNTAKLALGPWIREAHLEAGNDDALVGLVVHKRHGVADPGQQWVTCTLADLVALLTGLRPQEDQ